ncbi:MAG: hypothetical protein HQK58_02885 [Deltaproteobacteria bacterium]|nr:hypothetical protein [Deltaproteobacteria bacterium]
MKDRDTLSNLKGKNPTSSGADLGEDDILDLINTIDELGLDITDPPASPAPSNGFDQSLIEADIDAEIEQLFKEDDELRRTLDRSLSSEGPPDKIVGDDAFLMDEPIGDEVLKLHDLEDDEILLGPDQPPNSTEKDESLTDDIDLLFGSDNDLFATGQGQSALIIDENGKSHSEDDIHILTDLADDEMLDDNDDRFDFSADAPEPGGDEIHVLDELADDEVLVDDEELLEPDEPLGLTEEEAGQPGEYQDILSDFSDDEILSAGADQPTLAEKEAELPFDDLEDLDDLTSEEVLLEEEGPLSFDEPPDSAAHTEPSVEDDDIFTDITDIGGATEGVYQPTLAEKEAEVASDDFEDLSRSLDETLAEEEEPLILDEPLDLTEPETEPSSDDVELLAGLSEDDMLAQDEEQPALTEEEAGVALDDLDDLSRSIFDETLVEEEEPVTLVEREEELLAAEFQTLTEPAEGQAIARYEEKIGSDIQDDEFTLEGAEPIGDPAEEDVFAEATGLSVLTALEEDIGSETAYEEEPGEVFLQPEPGARPDDSGVSKDASWSDEELTDEELDAATADMFRLPEEPEPEPADAISSDQAEVAFDMIAESLAAASLEEDLAPPAPETDDSAVDEPSEPVEPPSGLDITDNDVTISGHDSPSFWEEDTVEARKLDLIVEEGVDRVYEQMDEEQITEPETPLDEQDPDVAHVGDILLLTPEMMEPPGAYLEPEQKPESIMAAISPEPALMLEPEPGPPMEPVTAFESAPEEKGVDKAAAKIDQIKFEETLAAIIVDQISEDRIAGLVTQAVENALSQKMTTDLVTRAFEEALTKVAREVMVEVAERIIGSAVEQLKGDLTIEE